MTGNASIKALQQFLTTQDLYSGPITGNYLTLTMQGVKEFQIMNKIIPSSGYFGPLTRAKANAIALSESPEIAAATSSISMPSPSVSTPSTPPSSLFAYLQLQLNSMFQSVWNLKQKFFGQYNPADPPSIQSTVTVAQASESINQPVPAPAPVIAQVSAVTVTGGSSNNSGNSVSKPASTPVVTPPPTPPVTTVSIPATTTLTLNINVNGGSATAKNFTITVKDNAVSSIIFSGAASSASPKFTLTQSHSYAVTEATTANSTNYSISLSSSCAGITAASPITCTITNTYNAPASTGTGTGSSGSTSSTQSQAGGTSGTTSGTSPSTPAQPSSGLVWGAYAGDSLTSLATFETLVGKPVDIQAMFDDWSSDFPSQYLATVGKQGKTLLVFWEPSFGYSTINNGNEDSYITQFATEAKSYGYPVILVPFDEMNLNEAPWGAASGNSSSAAKNNTPAGFIQAWQRMYNLFAAAGATNVKFAWDVNASSQPNTAANSIASYYPGSAYVDYVGVDGFNFGDPTQSFGQIFDSPVSQIEQYGKPIYIFSMGSYEYSGKAAWITDALGVHIKTYANIAGWIWFNQNDGTMPSAGDDINWTVSSDPASLAAFETALP
jgi:hypothetical protein